MMRSPFWQSLAAGAVWAALGFAAAIPLFLWGSDKAPEFYGAFVAAIVAAIAVILGAYYQAELTRRRDDAIQQREQIAEATDLYYWLEHAAQEMDFIASVLDGMHTHLTATGAPRIEMPIEQFREVVSARFMGELRDRAKIAARLPPTIAALVAPILYRTFSIVDRVYFLRGATDDFSLDLKYIEQQINVTKLRADQLHDALAIVGEYLRENGVSPVPADI